VSRGRVYIWTPDASLPLGGRVSKVVVDLGDLAEDPQGRPCLRNNLVEVRNGARRYKRNPQSGEFHDVAVGNAEANGNGDFLFEAGKGGGRLDKYPFAAQDFQERYVQAAHFGEVNTFYHLRKIASYINDLLRELEEPSLPRVVAVVNAHHAVTENAGIRDGLFKTNNQSVCFQGGHYRLPSKHHSIAEHHPLSPTGEIHLGPGRQLLDAGALVELAGCLYRANASHNAGIIYHEYGHHITRHRADFRVNRLRSPDDQDNKKPGIDEGTCDYWAAAMLDTPNVWALHKRHDVEHCHPRSLESRKTMNDFDASPTADPHLNGTIWAAALWDLRTEMRRRDGNGVRMADLLVLKTLALIDADSDGGLPIKPTRKLRASYIVGLEKLLKADEILYGRRFREQIKESFAKRKIFTNAPSSPETSTRREPNALSGRLRCLPADDIPDTRDMLSACELTRRLNLQGDPSYSVIAAGDIMLGDRGKRRIRESGADYPFAGVFPLLKRSNIVLGNLEGPLAREAQREERTFSYRVDPRLASSLKRAGINIVTLANNHLLDCGRHGVIETLNALAQAGIYAIGAGRDEASAHAPIILDAGPLRVGFLGYYWNKRCAATPDLPGSAIDSPFWLKTDIEALRQRVDRIVVTFHWGVPYERTPHPDDCAKARLAVDLGADIVVAHHPHIIQPFEIYKGRAIFYSIGNFAFGSGNSRAEGLLVAVRFEPLETIVDLYPIYVKNRDPRVNYQPKVLVGSSGHKILARLANGSGTSGILLHSEDGIGRLRLKLPKWEETVQ
jgi:hypothetical protein